MGTNYLSHLKQTAKRVGNGTIEGQAVLAALAKVSHLASPAREQRFVEELMKRLFIQAPASVFDSAA